MLQVSLVQPQEDSKLAKHPLTLSKTKKTIKNCMKLNNIEKKLDKGDCRN